MVTVLGGLAEFERELILARTSDGRARAKARGVRFGRPPPLTAHQRQEATRRLTNGKAHTDIARSFNVSQAPVSRFGARPFRRGRKRRANRVVAPPLTFR
jgi:DNA invertase Pin-like site-specific DNA recombinase